MYQIYRYDAALSLSLSFFFSSILREDEAANAER